MPPVAKRASEEALDLLNRAIKNKRSLSEFERIKIEAHLNSSKKVEQMEYYTASACYYAHIADIDNLLLCADYVFSRKHSEPHAMNVLFALYNTYQYRKIVDLLNSSGFQLLDDVNYIDISISAYSICNEFDKVGGIMENMNETFMVSDGVKNILYFAAKMHENFIDNDDCSELSGYLLDALNIYGKSMASSYRDEIGEASLHYVFFEDEGEKLFNLKFEFNSDDDEAIFDAEEDFLCSISKLNYKPSVRSKVSFSFESNSEGEK